MTVESENIGIDASVAKGGAVYLLAYHVPGTHTDLSLTARETVHLNGDSYGTYTYGNNMYLAVPVNPVMTADLTGPGWTLAEVKAMEADKG